MRGRELLAIIVLGAGLGLALSVVASDGSGSLYRTVVPLASTMADRLHSIDAGWSMFLAHPLFGAGLGAFIHQELVQTGRALVIHSTPIWMLAETGLIGTAFFVVPALALAVMCIGPARSGNAAAILLLLVFGIFGTMALVHDLLYQRMFWLLLGASIPVVLAASAPVERHDQAQGGRVNA
jgi:O-antigen ligase